MTFATKVTEVGRQAANILELDLDGCTRSYGVAPCTADLALRNDINWSQQFEQTTGGSTPGWQGGAFTTANQINAPDGTLTADELARIGAGAVVLETLQDRDIGLSLIPNNTGIVDAIYVKSKNETERYVMVAYESSSAAVAYAWFDIIDGLLVGTGGSHEIYGAGIRYVHESAEVGWFRIWFAFNSETVPGTPQWNFKVTDAAGNASTSGAIGDGVYIWGAQERPLTDVGAGAGYAGPIVPGKYAVRTTAVIDGGGVIDDLCFNAFGNCQDTANYLKEVRTYRFVDDLVRPTDLIDAYPAVKRVTYAPTRLNPGGKFSVRGKVTVVLQDFAHNDIGIDDYPAERTWNAETQGTFFGKFKERNKFYIGRPMRVLEGFIDPDGFSLADFRTREYIIENITGPTANGQVTIVGKDILALARNDRAKAPVASTYTLRAAMTAGQTTLLPQIGEAANIILGDKHVRVNDEIMLVVSHSPTDTLNVTRGQGGTTGAAQSIDDSVQECLTYENEPVIDVVDDLLVNFSGVPSSFIPTTDWEAEETESLSGYDMETIISTPTGVTQLLQEISEITLIDIWYSDVDQEVKLKLQTPFTEVTETWTDADNVVMDSVRVRDLNDQRLSRVLIYYGMRNFAEKLKEPENFSFINFEIETDKEGVNKYDDEKIRTIFSRWFDASNSVQVALTSQRLLARFGITPVEVLFDIDAKDVETLQTGDVFDLETRVIQDVDGTPKTTRFQITETKPKVPGHRYTYKSMAFFQDPTPDSLTISSNEVDYDIFVELGGPPGPVDVTLTLNTTIDVTATHGNPAITTTGMHPDSTLHFINNGDVMGFGGNGSSGGDAHGFWDFEPGLGCIGGDNGTNGSSGGSGGDALNITIDEVTIDNTNGNIWAGAGGGGGGGADSIFSDYGGGGGGGGGRGTDTGNAGSGGVSDVTGNGPGCGVTNTNGSAGTAGSTSAAGGGGSGGGNGGNGGAGGADWGDDGNAGSTGVGQTGGSGGNGGFAIRLNGASIVWEGGNTAAKVKGDVA